MANTVAYFANDTGYAGGATPPTAAEADKCNLVGGVVTGDGAATTITFTHNMDISTADLNKGWPIVRLLPILAAGLTAAPFVSAYAANSITVTCTAFTGAGLRIYVERPSSLVR